MARSPDWSALPPGEDPTPGDPVEIRTLGAAFTTLARRAQTAEDETKKMVDDPAVQEWVGFSAQAYKKHIGPVPGDIGKLQDSYEIAGASLTTYADELAKAQRLADGALTTAQGAQRDKKAAQGRKTTADAWVTRATQHLDKLEHYQTHNIPEPTPTELAAARTDKTNALTAQTNAGNDITTANTSLQTAQTNRTSAVTMRDTAATALVTALGKASDAGIQNLSWWERAADWFYDNVVPWLKVAVAVLGVIALFVSGPLGWIVFALAAVVLVSTVVQYARGKVGLGEVFMAVLDVLPGMKNLTMLAKGTKWATKAAKGLSTAGRAIRGSKVGGMVKPVAWAAGKTKNTVTAFGRNGKVMRGYNGTWTATGRFAKTKVAATKFGMQYVTNVGSKYTTTLSANYLNGKDVRLWDPGAFVNASVGAVVSVGGKGLGDKFKHRVETGRWRSTAPATPGGAPRNSPNPARAGTQRDASDAVKTKYTERADQHQQAADRHGDAAGDKRNEAVNHDNRADNSTQAANRHDTEATQHRDAADAHTRDAADARGERDAANSRADTHESDRAGYQRTADDSASSAQNHRTDADQHTRTAERHDATQNSRTQDADQHHQTVNDRTQDAQTHRDAEAGHRTDADRHTQTADRHNDRADAHDAKAREHDARADRDPANAQQHRDAAAQERASAHTERGEAQTHTAKADEAETRADAAHDRATTADRDAATARDAETRARDDAAQAKQDADNSRGDARASSDKADQADRDASTAQTKADDAEARRDAERTTANDRDQAAMRSDDKAAESTKNAETADKDAAVSRKEAEDARQDARTAERDAAREQARADDAQTRHDRDVNRVDGKDADGGARYQKPYHRLLDTTADTLNTRRHWYTGGLNSTLSSIVGKTAENTYLITVENNQMGVGGFVSSVGMSGAGGFAGGSMQQVATKWQTHHPAFTSGPFRNPSGDHAFQFRTNKPDWQHATTIEIATKRVGKLLPEAHNLGQDLVINATEWPMGPGA